MSPADKKESNYSLCVFCLYWLEIIRCHKGKEDKNFQNQCPREEPSSLRQSPGWSYYQFTWGLLSVFWNVIMIYFSSSTDPLLQWNSKRNNIPHKSFYLLLPFYSEIAAIPSASPQLVDGIIGLGLTGTTETWRDTSILKSVPVWQGISKKPKSPQDLLQIWATFQASFWFKESLEWPSSSPELSCKFLLILRVMFEPILHSSSLEQLWTLLPPCNSHSLHMKSSIIQKLFIEFHYISGTVLDTLIITTIMNKTDPQEAYILMTLGELSENKSQVREGSSNLGMRTGAQ